MYRKKEIKCGYLEMKSRNNDKISRNKEIISRNNEINHNYEKIM